MKDMKGKKVLVVGMGRSGIAATQAMVKLGAKVSVQDSKPADKIDPNLLAYFTAATARSMISSRFELNLN